MPLSSHTTDHPLEFNVYDLYVLKQIWILWQAQFLILCKYWLINPSNLPMSWIRQLFSSNKWQYCDTEKSSNSPRSPRAKPWAPSDLSFCLPRCCVIRKKSVPWTEGPWDHALHPRWLWLLFRYLSGLGTQEALAQGIDFVWISSQPHPLLYKALRAFVYHVETERTSLAGPLPPAFVGAQQGSIYKSRA